MDYTKSEFIFKELLTTAYTRPKPFLLHRTNECTAFNFSTSEQAIPVDHTWIYFKKNKTDTPTLCVRDNFSDSRKLLTRVG